MKVDKYININIEFTQSNTDFAIWEVDDGKFDAGQKYIEIPSEMLLSYSDLKEMLKQVYGEEE